MRARVSTGKRRPRRKRPGEPMARTSQDTSTQQRKLGSFYASGPAISAEQKAGRMPGNAADSARPPEIDGLSVPSVSGQGLPVKQTAHGQTVRLQGRTDADFNGGSFHTEDVQVTQAEDCNGCSGRQCVHVTGTLVATYSVTTSVTLPGVSDFPDLTPCQRERVQAAISNVLAPHEQQHVAAFRTYNGTTRRTFDLTLCRNTFDSTIRAMHQRAATAREAASQARSDALDPFYFDVDLDCEDEGAEQAPSSTGASGEKDQAAPPHS